MKSLVSDVRWEPGKIARTRYVRTGLALPSSFILLGLLENYPSSLFDVSTRQVGLSDCVSSEDFNMLPSVTGDDLEVCAIAIT